MGLRLVNLTNKNTKLEVCSQYNNREVDYSKSIIEIGKQLKIRDVTGMCFTHEIVVNIKHTYNTMTVETTKKIWNFIIYFGCKYCESEMDLLDEDDILGYRQYGCSNEKCQATYTIWGENYDGEWE
mgnify:CR=1 FL=1